MMTVLGRVTMALLQVGFIFALGVGIASAEPTAADSVTARQEMLQISMRWIRQFGVVPLDDTNPLPIASREHGPICVRYSGVEIGPISPICFDGGDDIGRIGITSGPRF